MENILHGLSTTQLETIEGYLDGRRHARTLAHFEAPPVRLHGANDAQHEAHAKRHQEEGERFRLVVEKHKAGVGAYFEGYRVGLAATHATAEG